MTIIQSEVSMDSGSSKAFAIMASTAGKPTTFVEMPFEDQSILSLSKLVSTAAAGNCLRINLTTSSPDDVDVYKAKQKKAIIDSPTSISAYIKEACLNPKIAAEFVNTRQRISEAMLSNSGKHSFMSLRLSIGLTQKQLAEEANVQQYQLSKFESGHGLSRDNIYSLWKAFQKYNIQANDFLEAMKL